MASGQVARIDSGRPPIPSQHTTVASARPRLRSSVSIVAHCLAPSPPAGPSHRNRYTASRGRFCHTAVSATISSVISGDRLAAHLGVIDLREVRLDLTGGETSLAYSETTLPDRPSRRR